MGALESFLTRVLTDVLATPALELSGRWKAFILFAAMTCLLLSAGFIYLLMSIHVFLQESYTAPQAAAMTGGVAFFLALCAVFGMILSRIHRKGERRDHLHNLNDNIVSVLETVASELDGPIAGNPKTSVIVAGLAGFLAGDRLRH